MKRRMKQLSLLLAGAALCLGVRISAIEASQSLEKIQPPVPQEFLPI